MRRSADWEELIDAPLPELRGRLQATREHESTLRKRLDGAVGKLREFDKLYRDACAADYATDHLQAIATSCREWRDEVRLLKAQVEEAARERRNLAASIAAKRREN